MSASIRGAAKSRGRPKTTGPGQSTNVRLLPPIGDALDAWIAQQPDPKPSRPEAIRRLLEIGLRQEFGGEDGIGALSAEGAFLRGKYPA